MLLCALGDSASERAIGQMLADGFRVVCAANGDDAVAIVRARRPDLVLLMRDRPEVDRLWTCHAIRACTQGRDMPIIVIAGSGLPEEVLHAFEAGASDYLVGPFSPALLLAKAQTWLLRAASHVGESESARVTRSSPATVRAR